MDRSSEAILLVAGIWVVGEQIETCGIISSNGTFADGYGLRLWNTMWVLLRMLRGGDTKL
ncbi:MAG: hypothetical protein WAM04_06755 [Candidatus Sulfotelmatobacter sp.]